MNEDTQVDDTDLDTFSAEFHQETPKVEDKVEDNDDVAPEDVDTPADDDTPDADDTPDDSPDGDDEDKPEEKPKKVNRFQERINELTAKAREAERALEALKAEQAAKSEPKPASQRTEDDAPTPDDKNDDGSDKYPLGEFDPSYIRDLTRHTIQAETKAAKEQEERTRSQRQVEEAREALHNQWTERLAPVAEQHEDFVEKTLELETAFDGLDANYSDYLVQTIKSLEHGPEVLYYFANNLEEAQAFVRKGPLEATLALGEINAMFKGQRRNPETKVSKAPPPPQVVAKGSNVRKVVPGDTDDLDAFSNVFFKKK